MQQLSFVDERVVRSIYHALRNYVVALGYYPDTSGYADLNDPANIADFKQKIQQIKATKGFYIELFSESSARNKGEKTSPRIVVSLDRSFNGEIGAPPSEIFDKGDGTFAKESRPGRSANLLIAVYLISHNSKQTYILNGIKDNILGERCYINWYDNQNESPFYIYRTGFYNLDDPTENITERGYMYEVPDAFLGDNVVVQDNIKPITEITVEIENPEDPGFIVT